MWRSPSTRELLENVHTIGNTCHGLKTKHPLFYVAVLKCQGLDHLLPNGRGAGGQDKDETDELQMACFMGLVSSFASTPEVLRVSPLHVPALHNAVAASIIQAATTDSTERPLTEAGLNGTGEVIQVLYGQYGKNARRLSVAGSMLVSRWFLLCPQAVLLCRAFFPVHVWCIRRMLTDGMDSIGPHWALLQYLGEPALVIAHGLPQVIVL